MVIGENGNWGMSVIQNIAKTMLSSDLKAYTEEQQSMIIWEKLRKVYTEEQLKQIRKLKSRIDGGVDCIYEVLGSGSLGRDGTKPQKTDRTDDTEGLQLL